MGNGRIDAPGIAGSGFNPAADSPYFPVATVQLGETSLSQVANRLHAQGLPVDLDSLQKLNPQISDSTPLVPGQWIRVPAAAGQDLPMMQGTGDLADSPIMSPSSPSTPASPKDDPISKTALQMRIDAQAAATQKLLKSIVSLGTNDSGQQVMIKRELGSPRGYDDQRQAIAVARLAHAEPAAVVQMDGRWHAVETTAEARYKDGKDLTRIHTEGNVQIHGLAPFHEIETARKEVVSRKKQLVEFSGANKEEQEQQSDHIEAKRREIIEELKRSREKLATLLFAVELAEIQFNRSPNDRSAGKINITANTGSAGDEGPLFQQGDHFRDQKSAIEINLEQLEDPAMAEGVLFHEVSHLKDTEMAQDWVKKYEQESGHTFVDGPPGRKPFEAWMKAQTTGDHPRLSKADAELVVDMAERDGRTSEARAFVHSALAALEAGAPDIATRELSLYASHTLTEHNKTGSYQNPVDNSEVKDQLKHEIQDAYKHMPKEMQQQLKDAIAEAHKANPESWISQIKLH